jgi:hypothetical protein
MAWDPGLGRVLLFGGANANGTALDDTWAWDGANWTQVADTGPEPRARAAMAGTGAVLLFGGVNSIDPNLPAGDRRAFGDTWRWGGQAWTKIQDIGPTARWGHGSAYRIETGRVVLFGGTTVFADAEQAALAPGLLRDTWEVSVGSTMMPPPTVLPQVVTVWVDPPTASNMVGEVHQVTVTLNGPAPGGIQLAAQIMSLAQGNPIPAIPPGFAVPQLITVGPQDTMTTFQITHTQDMIAPGQYAVAVVVEAPGATAAFGPFTVV